MINLIRSVSGEKFLIFIIGYSIFIYFLSKIILKFDGSLKNKIPIKINEFEISYLQHGLDGLLKLVFLSLYWEEKIIVINNLIYDPMKRAKPYKKRLKKTEKIKHNEYKDKLQNEFLKSLKTSQKHISEYTRKCFEIVKEEIELKLIGLKLLEDKKLTRKRIYLLIVYGIFLYPLITFKMYLGFKSKKPIGFLGFILVISLIFIINKLLKTKIRKTELGKKLILELKEKYNVYKIDDLQNYEEKLKYIALFGTDFSNENQLIRGYFYTNNNYHSDCDICSDDCSECSDRCEDCERFDG